MCPLKYEYSNFFIHFPSPYTAWWKLLSVDFKDRISPFWKTTTNSPVSKVFNQLSYIFMYVCVCMSVCVSVRGEREEGREVYEIFVAELLHQLSYKRRNENSSFGWAGYPSFSCQSRTFVCSQLSPITAQAQYLSRLSVWMYALYYLLLLATKKPGETSDSEDWVGVSWGYFWEGEAYLLLRLCPSLQPRHSIIFVSNFSITLHSTDYSVSFKMSDHSSFPQRIWTCLY